MLVFLLNEFQILITGKTNCEPETLANNSETQLTNNNKHT